MSTVAERIGAYVADLEERLAADGAQEEGGTPEHFGKFARDVIAKWQRVVKHAKIRASGASSGRTG